MAVQNLQKSYWSVHETEGLEAILFSATDWAKDNVNYVYWIIDKVLTGGGYHRVKATDWHIWRCSVPFTQPEDYSWRIHVEEQMVERYGTPEQLAEYQRQNELRKMLESKVRQWMGR